MTASAPDLMIHATTVALDGVAAVLRGPSGGGKSDLALRFLSAEGHLPWIAGDRRLIADDQTRLALSSGRLEAQCPQSIAGRLEVRGLGILAVPHRESARVGLVVELLPAGTATTTIARYPLEDVRTELLGVSLPVLRLMPFEASAPLKLALALATLRDVT